MKTVFTMEEVRGIIQDHVRRLTTSVQNPARSLQVSFIHQYSDGSGSCDVEDIAAVDRVEVTEC